MPKAFALSEVSLFYRGQQIFTDISLSAERGEIIAVCGTPENNKRYLVNVLTDTYAAPHTLSGQIMIDGAECQRLSAEEMRFMRMMNIAVLPAPKTVETLHMPVQKYITLPFRESVKKSKTEIVADTRRILELLGSGTTERIFKKSMHALSERDRMAIVYGSALATDPALAIITADTSGMTAEEADALYTLIIKVCKIKSIALLILTDDIAFARRHAEKIYVTRKDSIFPLEDASAHADYLTAMAESRALSLPIYGEKVLLEAKNAVLERHAAPANFVLHDKEIIVLPAKSAFSALSGKKNPSRGKLAVHGVPAKRSKNYKKSIMPIFAGMPIPPAATIGTVLKGYVSRPSQRTRIVQNYTALGLPVDYEKAPVPTTLYETLRLGLVCAAIAEAPLILLKDLDLLSSSIERYGILSLLVAVCAKTGTGAIVLSDAPDVREALLGNAAQPQEETLFAGI